MIEYLVKKRKITLFFFIVVVLYGVMSFFKLPIQEFPELAVNTAVVTTVLPGASPEKVEQTVTKKIEEKINEIQGLKSITSHSTYQVSTIIIETKDGVEPKQKWDELRTKIKDVERELPSDTRQSIINDDINKLCIDTFNLTANTVEELYSLRDTIKEFKDQLRTVENVADVTTYGLPEQEIKIEIDPLKLSQYGIPWTHVVGAIQKENEKIPLGDFDLKNLTYQLKVKESYNIKDLENIVVSMSNEGLPVYLKAVAKVNFTTKKVESYVFYNGKPAISISIIPEKGSDIPSLQKDIDKTIKKLKTTLPSWAELEHVYSQNERISQLFGNLTKETIMAIIAVLLVCSLGLNFITSFIIALAIPISISIGLLCSKPFDITLNMISVVSLIIVLGILVDDAVVVNDNIERRRRELGESPFASSVNGTKEVFYSILTATLATICSFGPIAFLKGNVGTFIRPLPLVISLSMLASMIMSLTIVPIFRDWYEERKVSNKSNKSSSCKENPGLLGNQIAKLTSWYSDKLMPKILKRPFFAGATAILISTLAYLLIPLIPIELFPNAIRPEMIVDIKAPYGSSINETNRIANNVSDWIKNQPGVELVATYTGGSAPNMFRADMGAGRGTNIAQVIVRVDGKKLKTRDLVPLWQEQFKNTYPEAIITPKELKMGPPVSQPVVVRIYGDDIKTLRELAQQVKDKIGNVQGTYNIEDNIGADRYSLEFEVNKDLMDKKMVDYNSLTSTIRLASEGINVSKFNNGKDLIDITMYSQKSDIDPMLVFQTLTVPNVLGQQIPLSEIAQLKPSFSIRDIPHHDLLRNITVTCDVREKTATEVMGEIKPLIDQIALPHGYTMQVAGETSEQNDIFKNLGKLLVVAVFLIIILIAIQFYSLTLPLLVMSTAYLAFAGSLVGLFITRTPLGFMSAMGAICLVGIVVRNGIVLIEFIENERHRGVELRQAVINAGRARLRPVLLTASTAIAGLLSLAFSQELLFKALAITIIFGLFYSTISTLVVVPTLYTVMAQHFNKKKSEKIENTDN